MAFPFLFTEAFDSGGRGLFDAETDTDSILDFPHYSALARFGMAPYRGAYCLRVRNGTGTNDAFVREDAGFDTAQNVTIVFRWRFFLGRDFTMADTNKFSMVELESVLNTTTEVAAGLDRSGDNIRFWYAETAAATAQVFTLGNITAPYGTPNSPLGRWYHGELSCLIDGAGGAGTIDAWIDDGAAGNQITTLTQAAIVDAKFGIIGKEAGTTGSFLIDQIVADDTRIFMDRQRYVDNVWVHAAEDFPIIGPGCFSAAVTGTGTNAVLSLYDADGVPNNLMPIAVLRNTVANELIPGHDEFEVKHGLYVTLTGTAPQGFISIRRGGLRSQAAMVTRGQMTGRPMP